MLYLRRMLINKSQSTQFILENSRFMPLKHNLDSNRCRINKHLHKDVQIKCQYNRIISKRNRECDALLDWEGGWKNKVSIGLLLFFS